MKKVGIILMFIMAGYQISKAQNTTTATTATSTTTVKTYGYVAYEFLLDTYKSVDSRDGELYYYPVKRVLDRDGKDINSRLSMQMLALQARFGFAINGPDVGTAKTTAQIEGDFYGTDNSYVNLVRLRQAWFKITWAKSEFIFGQASHPTIIADCSPTTLSFGNGVPYHPLNSCVQARFFLKPTPFVKLSIAALMASTHYSSGPKDAQRKSGLPELQFQAQFGSADKFLGGFTAGYKFLSLFDTTRLGYKTTGRAGSYNMEAFARITTSKFLVKAELNYGTNLTHLSMIGGYGVKAGSEDPTTGEIEFTSMKTLSAWLDFETKNPKYNVGLFGGISKNLGCTDDLDLTNYKAYFYNRNADISNIFRLAPRFFVKNNNLTYGIEWSLNGAAYALAYNSQRKATKTDDMVYNNRILFLIKYNF